jgi:predicted TPR repeat methyltransferase
MPQSQQSEKGTRIVLEKIMNNPNQVVLDVGAGEGKWGKLLKGKVTLIDGIEVWKPYINRYQLYNLYNTLYTVDLRSFSPDKKYDTAILGDVLEHLKKEEALTFLANLKSHVDTIFLTIPITVCIQDGNAIGNPYETHHYHWSDKEIRYELGFTILNFSVNDNGLVAIGCYEWRKS